MIPRFVRLDVNPNMGFSQDQEDFLNEDSLEAGDTKFGYRLLEIELEHLFGFDVRNDIHEYEGRI